MKDYSQKTGKTNRRVAREEPRQGNFLSIVKTIDPKLLSHKGLFEAEVSSRLPLRLAFVALLACCDSEGRFLWEPSHLKPDILPFDDVDVSKVLDALFNCGFIKKYEHEGKWYGCIPLVDTSNLLS